MWTEDFGTEFRSGLLEITKRSGICFGCSQSLMILFLIQH